jgi:hypothetical protein
MAKKVIRLETVLKGPPPVNTFTLRTLAEGRRLYKPQNWATDQEADIIGNLITLRQIKWAVEIGTGQGFTTSIMALAGARVYTFDPVDHAKIYNDPKFPRVELKHQIEYRDVPSPQCFEGLGAAIEPILWYLDAERGKDAMIRDFACIEALVKPKDIVIVRGIMKERSATKFWIEVQGKYPESTSTIKTQNGLGLYRP